MVVKVLALGLECDAEVAHDTDAFKRRERGEDEEHGTW